METVVGSVENCVHKRITPFSSTDQTENPVAYKLVRDAGDGRLVAATDEEISEVNETDMHTASDSSEVLPSLLYQLEISEGLSLDFAPTLRFLQYNKEMLQEFEQEERLSMKHESHMPSTSNGNNLCDEDQVHIHNEASLQEPFPCSSDVQIRCDMNLFNNVEPCSRLAASPKETALPPAATAQKPDFALVRGEICLDNLPIKTLQETFRATFGRETTVKDKTWLRRRIAMGLVNSCDVPTTNLTIKDNKLVGNQEKSNDVADVINKNMRDDVRAPFSSTDHMNVNTNASGHRLNVNYYHGTCEERAAKRVRKPTKRYIEELSETDEYKQQNETPMVPSKERRLHEKSEVRSISVSSGKRVTFTRMLSLAGSDIEVPYVSHVRRSRPRANILALMECNSRFLESNGSLGESSLNLSQSPINSEAVNRGSAVEFAPGPVQEEFATSHSNSEEHILTEVDQDMEPERIDPSGNSSDEANSISGLPIIPGNGLRRKHHRAWTISEVTKLVEGVSKYGAGKWSEIKKLSFSTYPYRTSVDLKDKWRNLLKASFAQTPSNNMGVLKKHGIGSMQVPMLVLLRVRELAEKQPQIHNLLWLMIPDGLCCLKQLNSERQEMVSIVLNEHILSEESF
ncbi:unnamed protein product [Cochlearia groenlandica]